MNSNQIIINKLTELIKHFENDSLENISHEKFKTISFILDLLFCEHYKPDNWESLTMSEIHEYTVLGWYIKNNLILNK